MTPDAAIALWVMGQCANRAMARLWADEAADRGATPAEVADAWAEWDRRADEDVTVIEVTSP